MTRDQFAEMVDYLTDRYGIGAMDAWAAAARIYPDYETLESEDVWAALLAKLDHDPKAEFPPKPPALRAAVLERIRHHPAQKALPETTDSFSWREWCQRTYGEVLAPQEAIRRRWAELDGKGKAAVSVDRTWF